MKSSMAKELCKLFIKDFKSLNDFDLIFDTKKSDHELKYFNLKVKDIDIGLLNISDISDTSMNVWGYEIEVSSEILEFFEEINHGL